MKLCTRHFIFIGIALFAISAPSGAADFMQGYYITLKGEIVYGAIDFQDVYKRATQCRFKRAGSDSVLTLLPEEIRGYRFAGGRYYVSKAVSLKDGNRNLFIECLVESDLSAFLYKDRKGEHYYLGRSGERLLEVPYKEGLKYIESKFYTFHTDDHEGWNYYHTIGHIPLLEKQLADVPALTERIKRLKHLNRHNFTNLISDYNTLRCNSAACVAYKTTEPSIRIAMIEPVCGLAWFPGLHRAGIQAGAICAISFPNSDESLQIRTGLIYLKELKSASENSFYLMPLQLQHSYVSDQLRINTYFGLFGGLSAGGELLLRIWKEVRFSMGSEIDIEPILPSLSEHGSSQLISVMMVSFHGGLSFLF
jgi:hypothetical protein